MERINEQSEDIDDTEEIYNDEPFDLDELLPAIDEFGKYQKMLLWFICLPACIPCGFCAFNQLFMADTPHDYWCKVPELSNISVDMRRIMSIPLEQKDGELTFSKCYQYAVNWSDVMFDNEIDFMPNSSWPVEKCTQGWEYNKTEVKSSIVIDFNLVCDDDIYPTYGLVALNVGGPVGVYFFGMLNDRAGRRFAYFTCLATLLGGSFITAASTGFWMWCFSRVIVGTTIPAVYQIPFIIALELVGPNYRSFVTVMTCTFYTSGIMMLAGVAYLVQDWVKLSLYTSIPFFSYYLYLLIMPESPRWLLMKGRLEEALKILEKMAKVNGKTFPDEFRNKLQERVRQEKNRKHKKVEKNLNAFDLCKTPNMRLKTLLITFCWFATETVYLGLTYYGPSMGENQYLSFFLSSLVEVPSYLLCWLLMDVWGRRWPMCLLMILSGIICSITVLLPDDATDETLILYLVAKSMISASFLIIYPFAGELYPTQARGVGIGTSSYIGGMGLIVIPFITYLGRDNLRLPLLIMGCVSVFGGIIGLRLPETLHHHIPQTLEEGEEFGKNWTCQDYFRCVPLKPDQSPKSSYVNLKLDTTMEMSETTPFKGVPNETTPLDINQNRRVSMRRLARQSSFMDTQKNKDGAMQLTYWF